jgi:hypothetical protein
MIGALAKKDSSSDLYPAARHFPQREFRVFHLSATIGFNRLGPKIREIEYGTDCSATI